MIATSARRIARPAWRPQGDGFPAPGRGFPWAGVELFHRRNREEPATRVEVTLRLLLQWLKDALRFAPAGRMGAQQGMRAIRESIVQMAHERPEHAAALAVIAANAGRAAGLAIRPDARTPGGRAPGAANGAGDGRSEGPQEIERLTRLVEELLEGSARAPKAPTGDGRAPGGMRPGAGAASARQVSVPLAAAEAADGAPRPQAGFRPRGAGAAHGGAGAAEFVKEAAEGKAVAALRRALAQERVYAAERARLDAGAATPFSARVFMDSPLAHRAAPHVGQDGAQSSWRRALLRAVRRAAGEVSALGERAALGPVSGRPVPTAETPGGAAHGAPGRAGAAGPPLRRTGAPESAAPGTPARRAPLPGSAPLTRLTQAALAWAQERARLADMARRPGTPHMRAGADAPRGSGAFPGAGDHSVPKPGVALPGQGGAAGLRPGEGPSFAGGPERGVAAFPEGTLAHPRAAAAIAPTDALQPRAASAASARTAGQTGEPRPAVGPKGAQTVVQAAGPKGAQTVVQAVGPRDAHTVAQAAAPGGTGTAARAGAARPAANAASASAEPGAGAHGQGERARPVQGRLDHVPARAPARTPGPAGQGPGRQSLGPWGTPMPVGAKARAFLETAQAAETARAAFARGTRAGLPPFPAVFMPESSLLVRRGPRAGARSAAGTDGARASAAEAAVLPFSGAQASLVAPSAGAAPSAVSPSGGIAPSLMAPNSPALAPSGAPATFPPPPGAAAPPSPAFGALPPLTHAAVKTRAARARAQSPLTAARPNAEASAARPARDAGEAQDARAARPAAVASAAAAARMSAGARGIRSTRSAADAARGQSAAPITAGTPGESASAGRALPLPAAQTFGSSASVSAAPAAAFHWKGRAGKALPLAVRAALEHAARRAARGGDAAGTVDAAAPVPPGVPLTLRDISARHPAPLRYHTVAQKPAARAAQPDRPAAGAPGAAFPRGSAAAGRMQAEQAAASDPRPDSGPVQAAEAAALRHRGGGTARTGGAFSAGRASAPAAADAGTPAENDPAAAPRASVFPPGRIQPGAQEGLRFAWPARGPYHLSAWSLSERPAAATALRHIALARAARAMVRRAGAPGTPSGVPAPAALRSAAVRAQMAAAFVASDASLPLVAPGQPLAYARTPSLPLAQEEPLTLARRASPPPPVPPQTQAAELPPPPSPAPPPPTEHLLPTRPPEQTAPPKVDVEQIARQVIVRVQQEMRLERMRLGRV